MKQALLLIQTKGKPDERVVSDFASALAKWKATATPDTHATLYALQRCKHKHIPAAPVVSAPPATEAPKPQPKQTLTKGK